ncbi:MAG: aminoglycoside phosphotransferase family protein [Patescibacteria group bacterium]
MTEPEIIIDGKKFKIVRQSRRGEVTVYTSGKFYARVGKPEVVAAMLSLHKKFDSFGFPVAPTVGSGEFESQAYFIEESLGDECFSFLFKHDFDKDGVISPELFERFISVSEKFARAQLRSATVDMTDVSFTKLVGPDDLKDELPEFSQRISERYQQALTGLKVFPQVLTQGDFNPHNIFPKGVIDFEETYYGPAGYDLVTNIFSNEYFPSVTGYEYIRLSSFTDEQKALYYKRLDAIYIAAGLPKISDYLQHFEFLRAIWLVKRNHRMPKLQQWRYELFKKNYLL